MKKLSRFMILAALALIFSLIASPASTVFAALANGTHEIGYEVQEAGGGSVSIADGYFSKPATLTVQDGVHTIQLTLTSSDMIKSLSVEGTPVSVVSDSGDTRVVKFNVNDASKPVNMDMHVIVPEMENFAGYDQDHGAQAVFDVSAVPALAATPDKDESSDESTKEEATNNDDNAAGTGEAVDNPPTGDSTPIGLYIALLVGSIAVFAVYRFRVARN